MQYLLQAGPQGLLRIWPTALSEEMNYCSFMVNMTTTCAEIIKLVFVKYEVIDDPRRFYVCEMGLGKGGKHRKILFLNCISGLYAFILIISCWENWFWLLAFSPYQVLNMTSLTLTVHCCISAAGRILTSSALNCVVEMKGLSRCVRKSTKFNKRLKSFQKGGIVTFYETIKMVVIGWKINLRMFRTPYTICFSSD